MAIGHEYDGGFAEYINLPDAFVMHGPITKISDNLPLKIAALSEPVACCIRGFKEQFFPSKISEICVYGGGPIGAIIATIATIKFPEDSFIIIAFKSFGLSLNSFSTSAKGILAGINLPV